MKVFNPQWQRNMEVDDKLARYMKAREYEPAHTGGGCFSWMNTEPKQGSRHFYTMITYIDVELGKWANREESNWLVGRYLYDEAENIYGADGWVCYELPSTLERALEIARHLPDPKNGEETYIRDEKELGGRRR